MGKEQKKILEHMTVETELKKKKWMMKETLSQKTPENLPNKSLNPY